MLRALHPGAAYVQRLTGEIVRAAPAHVQKFFGDDNLAEAKRLEADMGRSMNMTPELRAQIEKELESCGASKRLRRKRWPRPSIISICIFLNPRRR